jgi:hypothetical protein
LKRVKYLIIYFPLWNVFKIYRRIVSFLYRHQSELERDLRTKAEKEISEKYFSDRIVRGGIFKGLKYPTLYSHGSALFAKLAGTYESSLIPIFSGERFQQYNLIVDIGCAEGYYAVGSLLLNRRAKVIAVDTDSRALAFCKEMAELNGVQDRMTFATSIEWSALPGPDEKVLIICDCEGCEVDLFTEQAVNYLRRCDFIIELHDFIHPDVKQKLTRLFSGSHNVIILTEGTARPTFVNIFNALHRDIVADEQRPIKMEWLILRAK